MLQPKRWKSYSHKNILSLMIFIIILSTFVLIVVWKPNLFICVSPVMFASGLRRAQATQVFCETQWRHSVEIRLYNTPSPILHFVKRSDVTRWKQGYIRTLSILHCISQLSENKGRGHWVSQNYQIITQNQPNWSTPVTDQWNIIALRTYLLYIRIFLWYSIA